MDSLRLRELIKEPIETIEIADPEMRAALNILISIARRELALISAISAINDEISITIPSESEEIKKEKEILKKALEVLSHRLRKLHRARSNMEEGIAKRLFEILKLEEMLYRVDYWHIKEALVTDLMETEDIIKIVINLADGPYRLWIKSPIGKITEIILKEDGENPEG